MMMIGIFGPTSNRDQAIRAKLPVGGAKQFGKTILQKRLYQWTNRNTCSILPLYFSLVRVVWKIFLFFFILILMVKRIYTQLELLVLSSSSARNARKVQETRCLAVMIMRIN